MGRRIHDHTATHFCEGRGNPGESSKLGFFPIRLQFSNEIIDISIGISIFYDSQPTTLSITQALSSLTFATEYQLS